MNLKSLFVASALISCTAALSAATISDISLRQRWPWSQKVDISYSLVADEAQTISVNLYAGQTKLTVPQSALSGDIWNVSPGGPRTITFDPTKTAYTNQILTNFRAELSTGNPTLYMIVDLSKEAGAEGQITCLSAYDLTNSASVYGSWTKGSSFHTGPYIDSRWQDTIVWTGVTNGTLYKTTNIVFRYVPAGTFTMGSPNTEVVAGTHAVNENQNEVTLTKGIFVSVFHLTQAQFKLATGRIPPYTKGNLNPDLCPAVANTYNDLRSPTNDPNYFAIHWPATQHAVATNSVLAAIRKKIGNDLLDLPTEAQFEYTCRAGTTGAWNNGTTMTNETYDAELTSLAWYKTNTIWPVGMKLPNGWGLYDMHGNAWHLCLDWMKDYGSAAVENPVGETSGSVTDKRCYRNGGWWPPASTVRSARRSTVGPNIIDTGTGFRLYWTLE